MGDDDRAGIAQHLVPAGMIDMIMGVDDIADRLGRQPADFGDQRLRRLGGEKAVDHQHAIVADDEAGIGNSLALRPVDRRIDPRANLFQHEWKRRRRRGLGRGRRGHGNRDGGCAA